MRRNAAALVLILIAGSFLSLASRLAPEASAQARKSPYTALTPLQAKELIETKKDLQLVDVRTEREFKTGALPGSILVPYNSWFKADFMKKMQRFDKKKPILLVCAVGGRSSEAAYNLAGDGFVEVYNLSGGLSAWARQRVPLPQQNAQ